MGIAIHHSLFRQFVQGKPITFLGRMLNSALNWSVVWIKRWLNNHFSHARILSNFCDRWSLNNLWFKLVAYHLSPNSNDTGYEPLSPGKTTHTVVMPSGVVFDLLFREYNRKHIELVNISQHMFMLLVTFGLCVDNEWTESVGWYESYRLVGINGVY